MSTKVFFLLFSKVSDSSSFCSSIDQIYATEAHKTVIRAIFIAALREMVKIEYLLPHHVGHRTDSERIEQNLKEFPVRKFRRRKIHRLAECCSFFLIILIALANQGKLLKFTFFWRFYRISIFFFCCLTKRCGQDL